MGSGSLPYPRPLSRQRERGAEGGVRARFPTAYAVGYVLTPLTGLGSGHLQGEGLIN